MTGEMSAAGRITTMKKIAYVAGPMRGYPQFNFPAFFAAEERLVAMGYEVRNPASHDVNIGFAWETMTGHEDLSEIGFDLKAALLWDVTQVLASDLVIVLPGWENSSGARAEVALAKAAGIDVLPLAWVWSNEVAF